MITVKDNEVIIPEAIKKNIPAGAVQVTFGGGLSQHSDINHPIWFVSYPSAHSGPIHLYVYDAPGTGTQVGTGERKLLFRSDGRPLDE